jgi:hypothetical protein
MGKYSTEVSECNNQPLAHAQKPERAPFSMVQYGPASKVVAGQRNAATTQQPHCLLKTQCQLNTGGPPRSSLLMLPVNPL